LKVELRIALVKAICNSLVSSIAVHPEPAALPTHGLLSRRSTDRISTSPLANFAQLSMFRFDELIIAMSIVYSNTY